MNVRMAWCAGLALGAIGIGACGKVSTGGPDGGGDGDGDGGDQLADGGIPGSGLELVAATWDFSFDDGADSPGCVVTIQEDRSWVVSCPYGGVTPTPGETCTLSDGSTELTGTWAERFTGQAESVEEFTGICETPDVRTVNFLMEADRVDGTGGPGFLGALGGTWTWTATDPNAEREDGGLVCTAAFEAGAESLDFAVSCAGEPQEVSPACMRTDTIVIEGRLEPTIFGGTLRLEQTFEPSGCGEPSSGEPLALNAFRRPE